MSLKTWWAKRKLDKHPAFGLPTEEEAAHLAPESLPDETELMLNISTKAGSAGLMYNGNREPGDRWILTLWGKTEDCVWTGPTELETLQKAWDEIQTW